MSINVFIDFFLDVFIYIHFTCLKVYPKNILQWYALKIKYFPWLKWGVGKGKLNAYFPKKT